MGMCMYFDIYNKVNVVQVFVCIGGRGVCCFNPIIEYLSHVETPPALCEMSHNVTHFTFA